MKSYREYTSVVKIVFFPVQRAPSASAAAVAVLGRQVGTILLLVHPVCMPDCHALCV
jgi:hypothetical protein